MVPEVYQVNLTHQEHPVLPDQVVLQVLQVNQVNQEQVA